MFQLKPLGVSFLTIWLSWKQECPNYCKFCCWRYGQKRVFSVVYRSKI